MDQLNILINEARLLRKEVRALISLNKILFHQKIDKKDIIGQQDALYLLGINSRSFFLNMCTLFNVNKINETGHPKYLRSQIIELREKIKLLK